MSPTNGGVPVDYGAGSHPHRRRTTVSVLFLLVALIVGLASGRGLLNRGSGSYVDAAGPGPLHPRGSAASGFDIPVGEMEAWGHIFLTNRSDHPAEFRSIDVLEVEGGVAVAWLGLDLEGAQGDRSPGVGSWPPATFGRLVHDVEGAILEPGLSGQVVVGVARTSPEHGRVSQVQVEYVIGRRMYRMVLDDEFFTDVDNPPV